MGESFHFLAYAFWAREYAYVYQCVFERHFFFVFLFFLKKIKDNPKSSSIGCESHLMKQKLLVRIFFFFFFFFFFFLKKKKKKKKEKD
jgi:hypothetical protein